ncbi:MAG: hypothetical protein OEY49_13420, partial [Candidatus Heimdallarchaeota archaeon]|nr:hypothetical protein [Candidatus Heimdallarchaeota archaeon]
MNLNNLYNFKNSIRHFLNIDSLNYPNLEGDEVFSVSELSWTKPISFRVLKDGDKYRTIKLPNILSFVRAYYYYKDLPNFDDLETFGSRHRRLTVNLETGDFITGEYDRQIEGDLMKLCLYDSLI